MWMGVRGSGADAGDHLVEGRPRPIDAGQQRRPVPRLAFARRHTVLRGDSARSIPRRPPARSAWLVFLRPVELVTGPALRRRQPFWSVNARWHRTQRLTRPRSVWPRSVGNDSVRRYLTVANECAQAALAGVQ